MKKFVAMMMVVLMMICGVALAEEPRDVVDYINMSCLWYDMVDCGNSELVTALLGTELEWPTETLIGYVFDDDNGYFLEYIDEEGTHYMAIQNDTFWCFTYRPSTETDGVFLWMIVKDDGVESMAEVMANCKDETSVVLSSRASFAYIPYMNEEVEGCEIYTNMDDFKEAMLLLA